MIGIGIIVAISILFSIMVTPYMSSSFDILVLKDDESAIRTPVINFRAILSSPIPHLPCPDSSPAATSHESLWVTIMVSVSVHENGKHWSELFW